MALVNEHIASRTAGALAQTIEQRIRAGLPTLVFDRRIAPAETASSDFFTDTIELLDDSRWAALIVPAAANLSRDLQSFARALTIWNTSHHATRTDVPDFSKATGNPRILEFVKALYDVDNDPVLESIGNDSVLSWRMALRNLGEGPRAVVDDPWFSHLFLSPTAEALSLARPYTRVDLRIPRVPRRTARQIAAVVFDDFLARGAPELELVCFILDGRELEPVLRVSDARSAPNVRLIWIDEVEEDHSGALELLSTEREAPMEDDDRALYMAFSSAMDQRHQPAYVKGIMYGYAAFCTLNAPDELSEDLTFLRDQGMSLAMSSPLVELFDDD